MNYMREALLLAELGRYSVAPNPMVGCVIEKDGKIVGRGYHQKAGEPHAEVIALREAGTAAKNANIYVTLEPCAHYGRTPPCVDALIAAEVKSVHIPFIDPNPLVNGCGVAKLKAAGIDVYVGEEAEIAKQQNEVFLHYITGQLPYVVVKWAMTLDGKIAITSNINHATGTVANVQSNPTHYQTNSHWITGLEARQHVHQSRCWLGAVLVGVNTVIADDPQLTPYLIAPTPHSHSPLISTNILIPYRIILDGNGKTPLSAKVINFSESDNAKTIIATTEKSSPTWRKNLADKGVTVLLLPENQLEKNENSLSSGEINLASLLNALGKMKVSGLLVEGGQKVLTSFFAEKLVDEIHVYIAPKLVGDAPQPLTSLSAIGNININATTFAQSLNVTYEKIEVVGNDIFIAAKLNR